MNHISSQTSDSSDWQRSLPQDAFRKIMRVLKAALPSPEGEDTPKIRAQRDRAAMAAVASLLPETAAEGRLAAQFVMADAYTLEYGRLAQVSQQDPGLSLRYAARALGMLREAKSSMRLLLRVQTIRREMTDAAANRAEWVEHAVLSMMRDDPAETPDMPAGESFVENEELESGPAPQDEIASPKTPVETMPRLGLSGVADAGVVTAEALAPGIDGPIAPTRR
jgi:hypothetical protein